MYTVIHEFYGMWVISQFKNIEDIDAYLKEIDSVIAQENAKFEASKKALENKANLKNKK